MGGMGSLGDLGNGWEWLTCIDLAFIYFSGAAVGMNKSHNAGLHGSGTTKLCAYCVDQGSFGHD